MSTIVELQQRAAALKAKYQKESISPEEVGQLHEDTLAYMADLERYVDNLGVRKTYASKAEMDADTSPMGTNGKAMKFGQLAVIRSSDTENGNIYAYQKPGWLLVGNLNEGQVVNDLVTGGSNVPLSAEQGKVLSSMTSANATAIDSEVSRAKAADNAALNSLESIRNVIFDVNNLSLVPTKTMQGYINATGIFTSAGSSVHSVAYYDVIGGEIINATNISCAYQGAYSYAILSADGTVLGQGISMKKSTDTIPVLYTIDNLTIPDGGVTLMVSSSSYTNATPLNVSKIETRSLKTEVENIKSALDSNTNAIQSLNDSVQSIESISNDVGELDVVVNGGTKDVDTDITSGLPKYAGAIINSSKILAASSRCNLFLLDTSVNKTLRIINSTGDQVNNCYCYVMLNITSSEVATLAKGSDLTTYIVDVGPLSGSLQSAISTDSGWLSVTDDVKCVAISNYATAATLHVLQKVTSNFIALQDQINNISQSQVETDKRRKTITLLGDSTAGALRIYFNNWCKLNGYSLNIIQEGGNSALQLGAYIGAIPAFVKSSVTIPATGSVSIPLKSACVGTDGKSIDLVLKHYAVETGTFTHGLNPVSICGIKGNISRNNSMPLACVCFYDSGGTLIQSYDATKQGARFNVSLSGVASMRVCINANSATDVAGNSAHVEINEMASVDFTSYLINADTYLNTSGALVGSAVGFYASDMIPVTTPDITSLYLDGLAGNVNITFTRLTDGDAQVVESGAAICSEHYDKYKDTIILYFLNNLHRTGGDVQNDFVNEMQPVADLSSRHILATSHWAAHSYTSDQLTLIDGQMRKHFGLNQVSMYHYLSECGLADIVKYGVLSAEQVGSYSWEQVLLTGDASIGGTINVHENIYGAYLIARKLLERGADLGYWQLGDVSYPTLYNGGEWL